MTLDKHLLDKRHLNDILWNETQRYQRSSLLCTNTSWKLLLMVLPQCEVNWTGQQVKIIIYVMNPSHKDTCWLWAIRGSCFLLLYQQHFCKVALRQKGGTRPFAKYFTDMTVTLLAHTHARACTCAHTQQGNFHYLILKSSLLHKDGSYYQCKWCKCINVKIVFWVDSCNNLPIPLKFVKTKNHSKTIIQNELNE